MPSVQGSVEDVGSGRGGRRRMRNEIIQGSVLDAATWDQIPDQHVQTCITSPPYWGLRDYGVEGQLGLEKTPEEYVERMVEVFRYVWRCCEMTGRCG